MFPIFAAAAAAAKIAKSASQSKPKPQAHPSGSKAPASGIYSCVTCNTRRTVMKGRKLPPCHSAWIVVEATNR